MRVLSPAFAKLVAAPSTSLFPIHSDTNVGCAFRIIWTCVEPPRMNCVRLFAFEVASRLLTASITSAPGTAVLLTYGAGVVVLIRRRKQVVPVLGGSGGGGF